MLQVNQTNMMASMYRKSKCEYCGEEFDRRIGSPYACKNKDCQDKHYISLRICKECSIEFNYDSRKDVSDKFCSEKCQIKNSTRLAISESKQRFYDIRQNQLKNLPKKFHAIVSDNINIISDIKEPFALIGVSGIGKSVLMATKYKIERAKGNNCIWLNFSNLLFEIYKGFETKTAYSHIDDILKHSKIFIDDLGAEKMTEFARGIIYQIVNHCEENEKELYITSNLTLAEISKNIDDRIASRISGMCKIIKFTGEDRRLSK